MLHTFTKRQRSFVQNIHCECSATHEYTAVITLAEFYLFRNLSFCLPNKLKMIIPVQVNVVVIQSYFTLLKPILPGFISLQAESLYSSEGDCETKQRCTDYL